MQAPQPTKADLAKPKFHLLQGQALNEVAQVAAFGADKYGEHNWKAGQGLHFSRIFNALMRHAWAWWRGETIDPETGLHHMAHAAWNALALVEYAYLCKGIDDRERQGNDDDGKTEKDEAEPYPSIFNTCNTPNR